MDTPKPAQNEVLLKIRKLGIDGTDREINEGLYGEPPAGSDYLILGHEALAEIEEKGSETINLEVGQLVVPTVRRPGSCANCLAGESDMCLDGDYKEHGIRLLHGFASDYALTDANFVVPVPNELKYVAVLLEPLSIAEKALYQAMKIQQRLIWTPKRALVLGAGTLGLLVTILLRAEGFSVSSVARQPPESLKAKIVNSVGATYINSATSPLSSLDQKYDLIVEATGNAQVATQSARFLNANGVLCLLGVYSRQTFSFDMGDLLREVVLGNKLVFGSVNANKRYFELGLHHMSKVREMFPGVLERMITSELSPEEYEHAFHSSSEEIKTLILFAD
ncbi:MAG: glucose 1-dehydrogenase [Nitrososphaerota archaeon]|nr:glucose 1-dehydrogenase [Nitrososphaerota archaeon]